MSCAKCGAQTMSIVVDGQTASICPSCNIPDRTCAWCKLPMEKRLVGNGRYVHYLCPKCVFQHTSKYTAPTATSSPKT
jgi:hypothetical protein